MVVAHHLWTSRCPSPGLCRPTCEQLEWLPWLTALSTTVRLLTCGLLGPMCETPCYGWLELSQTCQFIRQFGGVLRPLMGHGVAPGGTHADDGTPATFQAGGVVPIGVVPPPRHIHPVFAMRMVPPCPMLWWQRRVEGLLVSPHTPPPATCMKMRTCPPVPPWWWAGMGVLWQYRG